MAMGMSVATWQPSRPLPQWHSRLPTGIGEYGALMFCSCVSAPPCALSPRPADRCRWQHGYEQTPVAGIGIKGEDHCDVFDTVSQRGNGVGRPKPHPTRSLPTHCFLQTTRPNTHLACGRTALRPAWRRAQAAAATACRAGGSPAPRPSTCSRQHPPPRQGRSAPAMAKAALECSPSGF